MVPANLRPPTLKAKPERVFSTNVSPKLHSLSSLDPRSVEFVESFRSLLSSKDGCANILALSEPDMRIFIEIIDRALQAARLDTKLSNRAFTLLRKLCGMIGHLPSSYSLSDKFDLSGMPRASGRFAEVRMGVSKGKDVAVKSLRVSEVDDKSKIRKRFCKEVVLWKNLSHPNVLNLIGVPDTLEDERFSTISEWMANGNIVEYVRSKAGNHLKLLADAVEGLRYLHNTNIVHGDLKGANILITNADPVTACLTGFEFATIVCGPGLWMESLEPVVGEGATLFMAPELLYPSRFGLEKCVPTKEADIYAIAMVVYQVLTGALPSSGFSGPEAVFRVLGGERPSKPGNAFELGLSDEVWKLLVDCWRTDRFSRPSIRDVSTCVKGAASVCGILSSVGSIPQRYGDPDSDFPQFDPLFPGMPSDDEELDFTLMERPPSQGSILTTVTSSPDSLFSKFSEVSEAKVHITRPPRALPDAVPDILISPVLDHVSHSQVTSDPIPRSFTPGSEAIVRLRPFRDNLGSYWNKSLAEFLSTAYPKKPSAVGDLVTSSFLLASNVMGINMGQAKDDPTRQLRRISSVLSPYSSKSREIRGGCPDVRMGVSKGKDVAVKSLRVSEVDDKSKIRKRFCKEVVLWKHLSHPNVLNLIGVPDTLEDERFSTISEWMANGNIVEYVRNNAGNHLKLLADAVEGLRYLHNTNIVHGDLKGANILIVNTNPVSACLADFGFSTMVHEPSLEMESSKSQVGGGTTPFMAPELLIPSRFGLDKCTHTKEADIYAMGMVIYQVLTGTLPFSGLSGSEVVFKVFGKERPSKPANALELGLSDRVWKLLEDCWQTDRHFRPSVREVSDRVKGAASLCGILSPIGGLPQWYEDPGSEFVKFDELFIEMAPEDEEPIVFRMERPPSQESTLTDVSLSDSLFSKLSENSEAESHVVELLPTKAESAGALPDTPFSPVLDHVPHPQVTADEVSRSSTPSSETTTRPRPSRENPSPYRNKRFADSNGSSQTTLAGVTHAQQEQPRSDTVVPHDREAYSEKPPTVGDLAVSSFLLVSDAAAIATTQARDDPTLQLRRPASMLSLYGAKSRPIEADVSPQIDDRVKQKPRQSRFQFRQRIGKIFAGDTRK